MEPDLGLAHFLTADDGVWQRKPVERVHDGALNNQLACLQLVAYIRSTISDFDTFMADPSTLVLPEPLYQDVLRVARHLLDTLVLAAYIPAESARLACVTVLAHLMLFTVATWSAAEVAWATRCLAAYEAMPSRQQPTPEALKSMQQHDQALFTLYQDVSCPFHTPCKPFQVRQLPSTPGFFFLVDGQPQSDLVGAYWQTIVDSHIASTNLAQTRYLRLILLEMFTFEALLGVPDDCDDSTLISLHPDEEVRVDLIQLQQTLDFDYPDVKYSLDAIPVFVVLSILLMSANGLPLSLHLNRACGRILFLLPGTLRVWAVCLRGFRQFGVFFAPTAAQRKAKLSGFSLATQPNPTPEQMLSFVAHILALPTLGLEEVGDILAGSA